MVRAQPAAAAGQKAAEGVTFQAWVDGLIADRFGTKTKLAALVGMKLSPFTRGVESGTLSFYNLLRLADVADVSPTYVLRLAKKEKEAELLEKVCAPATGETLTREERAVLEDWRAMHAEARPAFRVLIRHAAELESAVRDLSKQRRRGRGEK